MHSDILEQLVKLDHMLWYYLNVQWHNDVLDHIVPFFRNPVFWSPLYLFLLLFMPSKFGKKGVYWCLFFLCTFALTDQVCATFLKPYFHRFRPCHNPWLNSIVHMVIDCGGEYGFPSNHAANHFALGIFMGKTIGKMARWIWPACILWALLVSYSQVYVGAHFPADVLFGGVIGVCIGIFSANLFNSYFMLAQATEEPAV